MVRASLPLHRRVAPTLRRTTWALLVVAVTLVPASAAAFPAPSATPHVTPTNSFQAGAVYVHFPSAVPSVQLSAVGNDSILSALSIAQVLEVNDRGGTPTVVAVAYPTQVTTSNRSTAGSASPNLVTLSAALTVYPANASLWAEHGALVAPIGTAVGTGHLEIDYSVGTGSAPGSGVLLNWSIDSWVWSAPTDLLGLQLGMQTPQGVGIVACNGALDSDAAAPCSGTTLASGGSIWAGSIGGVEDRSASGAAATVSWSSTASAGAASPAEVTAGVLAQSSVEAQLLLAAAGSGSSHLSGSVSFTLHPPLALPPAPALIRGEAGWFGGALLGFAVVCALGAFAYRRAVRRSEREL